MQSSEPRDVLGAVDDELAAAECCIAFSTLVTMSFVTAAGREATDDTVTQCIVPTMLFRIHPKTSALEHSDLRPPQPERPSGTTSHKHDRRRFHTFD